MVACEVEECKECAKYGVKRSRVSRCKEHKKDGMVTRSERYCEHNQQRNKCKECGGSQICEHKRQRSRCKECGGSQICEHKRIRSRCKECKGVSICEHSRRRDTCKECRGSQICKHKRQRNQCKECKPESNYFCIRRYKNNTRCPKGKQPKYDNYCVTCFVDLFPGDPRSKTVQLPNKELKVLRYLTEKFPDIFIHNKQLLIANRDNTCTPHNRRIDFQTEVGSYVFCIEVDENQHKWYDPLDEEKRIMEIYENADRKMIFIRFNPDNYIQNEELKKTSQQIRLTALENKIKEVIDKIENGGGYDNWYTEIKMFFDDSEATRERKEKNSTPKRLCSGVTKKKKPCGNRAKTENEFCHLHEDQKTV